MSSPDASEPVEPFDLPPDLPPIRRLDEAHFLDHWPGTKYCRSKPGGTIAHLLMSWERRQRKAHS